MSRSPRPRASHHPRNCPTALPYAARVLAFEQQQQRLSADPPPRRHLSSPACEPGRRDLDHVAPPLRDPGMETRHGPPRRPEPGRRPLASPGASAPRDTPLESPQPPHVREPDRVDLIPGRADHRHLRTGVDPDNPDVRGRPPAPVELADDARVPAPPARP